MELSFDATTNLEGSKECRYEVSGEVLLDRRRVFNFANKFLLWFLEVLDVLGMSPAGCPRRRHTDILASVLVRMRSDVGSSGTTWKERW